MWQLRFTLTILAVVSSAWAIPRPDFAISATISGKARVQSQAVSLGSTFQVAISTPALTSGYTALSSLQTTLLSINTQIKTIGGTLSSALNTLAGDSTGPIATSFGAVNSAITSLANTLSSGLNSQLASIDTATGKSYISNEFKDAFNVIKRTLTSLSAALTTLQGNVSAAKTAAGSGTITPVIVAKYIPPSSVNNVL